jgi:hypothetical protein
MDLHMADQDGGAADPFNPAGGSVGTKRGLADSQACLDEQRPSQEQQHEEAEAAEEEEPPPALTSLVAQGLADTEARRQQLHGMVRRLAGRWSQPLLPALSCAPLALDASFSLSVDSTSGPAAAAVLLLGVACRLTSWPRWG